MAANVQLYYRIMGAGGDTVVVLHGGPGFDMGYPAPDLEPLADSHVLIFYDQRGGGRPAESAREWEAAFPNVRLVLLDAAGHNPHVEQPDECFSTVEAFLR